MSILAGTPAVPAKRAAVRVERDERLWHESRPHGIVLLRPLSRSMLFVAAGLALIALGWPLLVGGALLAGLSALVAFRAVWRWERTLVVVTDARLLVVAGTLRRRGVSVPLGTLPALEIDE